MSSTVLTPRKRCPKPGINALAVGGIPVRAHDDHSHVRQFHLRIGTGSIGEEPKSHDLVERFVEHLVERRGAATSEDSGRPLGAAYGTGAASTISESMLRSIAANAARSPRRGRTG